MAALSFIMKAVCRDFFRSISNILFHVRSLGARLMHAKCPLRVYNNNSVVYTRAYNARILFMARVKINVLATYIIL